MEKVLVITGASRGIGAATARLAGAAGYSVCVNYRQNQAAADRVVADIQAHGAKAIAVCADVSIEADVVRLFETTVIYTEMYASGGEPDRVNRVKEHVPMRRGGEPEEVARAILWLLSDEASFTTGAFIDVTGGR